MREDDAPENGTAQGSLADGLGEVAGDDPSSSTEPYGDEGFDDGAYGDGGTDDDATTDADTTADGDVGADELDPDAADLPDDPSAEAALEDPLAQDGSPLEGIGFLLDELHDALFGDDDGDAASAVAPDPADLASESDFDLTGDGVVDTADLHEAESPFDFDVDASPGHHDGVIDL
jgi:hypothetical protein